MSDITQTCWLTRGRDVGLLVIATCLFVASAHAQNSPSVLPSRPDREAETLNATRENDPAPGVDLSRSMSFHQKQSIVQANFQKSKHDAAELASMAKALCEELDKPNADVLSLGIVSRMEKIEKLAKKIRDETKGF
ncbi:MAG: hypothetical protein ACLQVG_27485 [Terriglobia bacterium]